MKHKSTENIRHTLHILFLGGAYFVAATIGLRYFDAVSGFASLVWPPSGIALAALLLGGYRLFPGILLGAFLANFANGAPLILALLIGAGNTLEALAATWLLKNVVRFTNTFVDEHDVFGYVLVGCAASVVAATVGVTGLFASDIVPASDYVATWSAWWVGDLLGIVLVAPFILLWWTRPETPRPPFRVGRAIEVVLLALLFITANFYVWSDLLRPFYLGGVDIIPLPYFVFFPLVLIALRFGARMTILATFATAVAATIGTTFGTGVFGGVTPSAGLYQMQLFLLFMMTTILIIGTVVAKRTRAEEKLSDQSATLVEAQALAHVGSWEYQPFKEGPGKLIWSDELYRIYGLIPGARAPSRETFISAIHPDDRAVVEEAIDAALSDGKPFDLKYRIIRSGTEIRYLHSVVRSIDGRDHGKKMIGVSKDITERTLAEAGLHAETTALEAALAEIRATDAAKTRFLAALSHELRNPLAPILSAVELLQIRKKEDPETARLVAMIERQVRNLKALLGDLLDLSRVEREKITLRKEPVEVATVIKHAEETAAVYLTGRKHAVIVSISGGSFTILVDPLRMEQMLVNLLYNAAKYSAVGSPIMLSCRRNRDGVEFVVADQGRGIDPSFLPRIFEPFAQYTEPGMTPPPGGGLGIGLHLVKAMAELHGGKVTAASKGIGQGSTFTIHFPENVLIEKEPGETNSVPAETVQNEKDNTGRPRIIVVDDNEQAALTLSELLRVLGYAATSAFDGPQALALVREFAPDAFLLDIGLPHMDGYTLARHIRQGPAKNAALIALTGYGQEEDRKRALDAGFDEHLTKPVGAEDLRKTLEKYLGGNAK